MNRNQFVLLVFLLVVLGLAGLMVYNKRNNVGTSGDPAIGKKLLGDLPVNDVASISLKQGTNELTLIKKDNLWRVHQRDDYPANYSEISEFLLKARDLKIVQSEHVGPSQLPRLELVPGNGTNAALVVDLKDQNDKPIRSMLLGKKHMQKSSEPSPMGEPDGAGGWPDGRYVKVGANSDAVALISDALSNIEPKPDAWLNKDFFRVEKVRSIAVSGPAVTNAWKIERETENGDWKLADAKTGEQLDNSKASSAANALGTPSFTDVEPAAKSEQFGLNKPTVVTLDTFENFTYTVDVGAKTNDSYPITVEVAAKLPAERTAAKDEKPADKTRLDKEFKDNQKKLEDKLAQEKGYGKWIYLVSSWTLEPLLKDRAQLLVEKKEEPKKETKAASNASATGPVAPLPASTESDPAEK